jgi:hypothetical protein
VDLFCRLKKEIKKERNTRNEGRNLYSTVLQNSFYVIPILKLHPEIDGECFTRPMRVVGGLLQLV